MFFQIVNNLKKLMLDLHSIIKVITTINIKFILTKLLLLYYISNFECKEEIIGSIITFFCEQLFLSKEVE